MDNATERDGPRALDPADTNWRLQLSELIRIAMPLSISQISEMLMGVTDNLLLGRLGAHALAIGGLVTSLFFVVLVTFQSGLGGVSVLVSRARGAARAAGREDGDYSGLISAGLGCAVLLCLPVFIVLFPVGAIFRGFGEPESISGPGVHFMHIWLWALFPDLVIIGLLRIVLPAFGSQKLLLWTMPVMAVVNGLLNGGLINGWFGLPRLGYWGSPIAGVITGWIIAVILLVLSRRQAHLRPHLRLVWPKWSVMWEMLRIGLPLTASTGAEVAAFQVTGLRAGHFGTQALAAHQIAVNVTGLLFMISLALSQAVNIRVAYWIGAGELLAARRAAFGSIALVVGWCVCSGAFLVLFPEQIVHVYLGGHADQGHLGETAGTLLKISAVYQIFDGLQVVCAGALRACHDTVVPMVLIVGSYCLFTLLGGGWLANQMGMGVIGLWIGLAGGLFAVGIILPYRLWAILRKERLVG